jgi:hypothetical protein
MTGVDHDLVRRSSDLCETRRSPAGRPARQSWPARGRKLAYSRGMAVILLVLFPFLLMVDTRVACVAMATAIALICGKRFSAPRRAVHRPIDDDASI